VTVRRLTEDTTWVFTGPIRMDVTTNLVDFGEIRPDTGYGIRSAMHIYETVLSAAQRMRAYGFQPFLGLAGDAPWQLTVRWQPGTPADIDGHTSTMLGDSLFLAGVRRSSSNRLSPDEWDDHMILHEYGHHLARLGGFSYFRPTGTPDTCYVHQSDRAIECPPGTRLHGLAWEEGWCNFIAVLLDSTPPTPIIRDWGFDELDSLSLFTFDLETGAGHTITSTAGSQFRHFVNDSGPAFEGANAGALWDLVDLLDDDQNGDGCGDQLADTFEQLLAVLPPESSSSEARNDSLVNIYMAYQREHLIGDLARSRALFRVLCEHGFWEAGDARDTTGFVDVDRPSPTPLAFRLSPSIATESVRFTLSGTPATAPTPPTIEVFDVAGRVLWKSSALRTGESTHSASWNTRTAEGQAVRSGVYFARCSLSGESFMRTLVVRR